MYSIVFFTPSADSSMKNYIDEQIKQVKLIYPDILIEHRNESDNRLYRFSKKLGRFPVVLILKNNSRKAIKHSKLSLEDLLNWLDFNLR